MPIALLLLAGCKKQEAQKPAYLTVPQARLVVGADTSTVAVQDLWLYQYPQYQGSYALPARFPILEPEKRMLIMAGGVWKNGDPVYRELYPFWAFDTTYLDLKPLEEYTVTPNFRYRSDSIVAYPYVENFEFNDTKLTPYNPALTNQAFIEKTPSVRFRGGKAARIAFNGIRDTFQVVSNDYIPVPRDRSPVWSEVAYRGDIKFAFALLEEFSDGSTALTPRLIPQAPYTTDRWQVCYFNLTDEINAAPAGTKFKIFLLSGSGGQTRTLYLDEIRVLHYK